MGKTPEVSLGIGIATMTVAFALYNNGMPKGADIRASKPGDETLEAVRKQNAWMAAAAVAGISILAKDATVFVLGGLTVVALDWNARFNSWTNPTTNSQTSDPFSAPAGGDAAQAETDPYVGLSMVQ